ncbi:RNA polymerase sigma factor [Gracilibacillus sp. S3-1-1]|uniref:RNA polymerase sigma factor n=1 Tax=Gracilibacillus pellucidus TaxID=3095368 RepID=A0ACC6M446_9BACI|nr:RNA polymerase sigma factor [Gracilibacillus sp. S3-1-1]MDX8045741.1 RNA polymerase sigma factor [Gracilibacillus sp. S3-1-1]
MSSNDPIQIENLFNTYHQQIYQFTYRYTQDEALSYDIVQDTFIKFQKYADDFDPTKSHIRTFLFRIAYQLTITKLKRQNKFKKLLPFLYEQHQEEPVSLEEKLTIRTALQQLKHEHRSVIIFSYYHDLSQKEIADILQIPIGTVKSRLHTSLRQLKHLLEVDDNE